MILKNNIIIRKILSSSIYIMTSSQKNEYIHNIKKEIYIVLVEDKETHAITNCLEVRNGKKLKLVQAKGKY